MQKKVRNINIILLSVFLLFFYSAAYSENVSTIAPPKFEREISILGIKIGDNLKDVQKNAYTADPLVMQGVSSVSEVQDPVSNKTYVDHITMRYFVKGTNDPFDTIDVYFSDPNSGNRVSSIYREYHKRESKKILQSTCLSQLTEKFGKPTINFDTNHGDDNNLLWYFDGAGKLVDHPDPANGCPFARNNRWEYIDEKCPGTTVYTRINSYNGIVNSIKQNIISHSYITATKKYLIELTQESNEKKIKTNQQDAAKNKINF